MRSDESSRHSQIDPSQWIDEYGDFLYRYAMSRLRDADAAEEVVQETLLAGIRYHEQFSGRSSELGWLTGILKRKIIDHVRVRMKHQRTTSLDDKPDSSGRMFDAAGGWKADAISWAAGPDAKVEMSELWDVVQDCLEKLPVGQADVFTLSVMEEMDAEEICRQLEITPSNFWVRMHRARLGLAKCVGSRWHDAEKDTGDD